MKKIALLATTLTLVSCSTWTMEKWERFTKKITEPLTNKVTMEFYKLKAIKENKKKLMNCFNIYGLGSIEKKALYPTMQKMQKISSMDNLWQAIHKKNNNLKNLLWTLKLLFLQKGSIYQSNQPIIQFRNFITKNIPGFVNQLDKKKLLELENNCPADLSATKPINLVKISLRKALRERIKKEKKLAKKNKKKLLNLTLNQNFTYVHQLLS